VDPVEPTKSVATDFVVLILKFLWILTARQDVNIRVLNINRKNFLEAEVIDLGAFNEVVEVSSVNSHFGEILTILRTQRTLSAGKEDAMKMLETVEFTDMLQNSLVDSITIN